MPHNRNLIHVISLVAIAIAIALIAFAVVGDGNNMWLALVGAAVALSAVVMQAFAARGRTTPRA